MWAGASYSSMMQCHHHKTAAVSMPATAAAQAGTTLITPVSRPNPKRLQQRQRHSTPVQAQLASHTTHRTSSRPYRHRTAAAAPDTLVTADSYHQPTIDFLGVLNDMQTVRGTLQTAADPDLVYDILCDYDSCSRVFRNISGSQTLFTEAGDKQVIQACKWQFLAFKGTFNVHLNVHEAPEERLLVFTLAESSFMRDFEGRWQVKPLPGGGSSIEHVLAVKPVLAIPAAVANYTSSIFKSQVAALLADLQAEIDRQAEAAAAAAS